MSDEDLATGEFPEVERRGRGSIYDEEKNPRARKSDTGWRYWGGWLYRHLVPAIAIVVAAIAVGRTQSDVDRQREGRAVAIDVLCGFGNGVAEAGRKALSGELAGQNPSRGLPQKAQTDYVRTITSSLLAESGFDDVKLIRSDGQLNCDALRIAAKAQPSNP